MSDSPYEEATERGGEQWPLRGVAELPRALSKPQKPFKHRDALLHVSSPPHPPRITAVFIFVITESLWHSQRVLGHWGKKKKKDNCFSHLKFISSRGKQKWLFSPKLPVRFPTSCIKVVFPRRPHLCLKADLQDTAILFLSFLFRSTGPLLYSITLFNV